MKVTRIDSQIVQLPAEEPLVGGPAGIGPTFDFVAVRMRTDDGLEGIGCTFYGGALTGTLKSAVDELGVLVVGEDPLRIEAIVAKLLAAGSMAGPAGIFTLALGAIDIALWDIRGKALGQPVATLVGGRRTKVPTYASGALMRSFSLERVLKAAPVLVEKGFRQMKTQLALPGDTNPVKEVERIRLLREAVGDEIDLMCDINQRWDVRQAISIGQQLEPFGLYWLEDVTACDDYAGLARITDALATPVAGGEYLWGIVPFRHMMEARSVDIVMADVLTVGGITQWLKIAAMAEAFNLPVVSHLFPEVNVHLIAGVPNGLNVEYMPWSTRLFEEVPMPVQGELTVPNRPGLGLSFDRKVVRFD